MTIERALRGIAGTVVLLSLALAWLVNGIDLGHPSWLWFTAFVGSNLLQSAFTNWCPMIWVLQKAGLPGQAASAGVPWPNPRDRST
jgi:hypothetical protein